MPLKIAQLGQPVLRAVAEEVPADAIATPEFQQFVDDLHATLARAGGVGLAAPQVFDSRRVFIAGIGPEDRDGVGAMVTMINPRLTPLTDEVEFGWEGCLSFLELMVLVPRVTRLRVDYLDRDGRSRTLELEDFEARVVQHENDHLDGVLIVDRPESPRDIVKASEIDDVLAHRKALASAT